MKSLVLLVLMWIVVVIFLILSLPIYLYRILIVKCLAPLFSDQIGNVVSPMSMIFATALPRTPSENVCKPKSTLLNTMIFSGDIPDEDLKYSVRMKWIERRDSPEEGEDDGEHGDVKFLGPLRYPELQQYVGSWMGFLFWKWDKHFNLDNHFQSHCISHSATEKQCEEFLQRLKESLMNKPYLPRRSPWELHLVHNYKNSQLCSESENGDLAMTVIILRMDHCLADGYSTQRLVVEDLFEEEPPQIQVHVTKAKSRAPPPHRPSFLTCLRQTIIESLSLTSLYFNLGKKSPYRMSPEAKEMSDLMISGSGLIPLEKLKRVSKSFGVPFTAVLMSCVSAGLAKNLRDRRENQEDSNDELTSTAAAFVLPKPGHPRKLVNHYTFGNLELSLGNEIDPLKRLQEMTKFYLDMKNSFNPLVIPFHILYAGCHLAPVAKKLMVSRTHPLIFSTFPSSGGTVFYNGRKAVSVDTLIGLMKGVIGMGAMIISYNGHLRINLMAESCVMSRDELNDLVKYICEEIDTLHTLSLYRSVIQETKII